MSDLEKLRQKVFIKPYQTVLFQGHEFHVLDIHEAHQLIGELKDLQDNTIYNIYEDTWRFPLYETNTFFLFTNKEASFETLDLSYFSEAYPEIFILGLIFGKKLQVKQYIQAADTDNSPVLVALSDVSAQNIHLFGNVHYVGSNMTCEVVWGEYNHGELHVKGNLTATFAYADDMRMFFHSVNGLYGHYGDSIYTLLPVTIDGKSELYLTYLPNSCLPKDILKDDFEQGLLIKESMLDTSKIKTYGKESFDEAFEAIFAKFPTETIKVNSCEVIYQATPIDANGVKFKLISKTQLNGFNYRIVALLNIQENTYKFLIEFYTDQSLCQIEYYWELSVDENTLFNRIAKHNFFEAVTYLLSEH